MKKTILFFISAAIIAAATCVAVQARYSHYSEFEMSNIEALQDDEGTPVNQCYIDNGGGPWNLARFCNKETSSEMIYPCPEKLKYGNISQLTLCTR